MGPTLHAIPAGEEPMHVSAGDCPCCPYEDEVPVAGEQRLALVHRPMPPDCPECAVGKHAGCDRATWHEGLDIPVGCPCDARDHAATTWVR